MKKLTTTTFLIILICISTSSFADGIGLYGTAGGGDMFYVRHGLLVQYNAISHTAIYGCGIMTDTDFGMEKMFSYRARIGYDFQKSDNAATSQLHRVLFTNILAFGIYRKETVRLWVGPQLGIGYIWGSNKYFDSNVIGATDIPYFMSMGFIPIVRNTLNINHLNLHVGLTLGMNINISEHVTLPIEGGFRFNFYAKFKYTASKLSMEDIFKVKGPEGYLSVGVMYRFKESSVEKKAL